MIDNEDQRKQNNQKSFRRRSASTSDVRALKSLARKKTEARKIAKTLRRTEGATRQKVAQRSVVWPFETGWATKAKWVDERILIVHAEIYPKDERFEDTIRDRGQVRAMWDWGRNLDREDQLWFEFARPIEIDPGSPEDISVQLTKGWILRSSSTVRPQ